ncbi:MAG: hypothetical protein JO110_04985 [Acetobacteraceae bacterium]|nr:hypothetical protein [Acetobacteraceae bacterium]MBV8459112.1 hypothetical protein [Acetobacteraceae bacterium]
MTHIANIDRLSRPAFSPLMLTDGLIRLAEHAAQAGFAVVARQLVEMAFQVLDPPAECGLG